MGCGQSIDSAYSNRRNMSGKSWAQTVGGSGRRQDRTVEPAVDRKLLEEYLQLEREIAEAQLNDPQVLNQLKNKSEALQAAIEKVDQLEQQSPASAAQNGTAPQELAEARRQVRELSEEVNDLKYRAENLQILHLRQDDLLARIFGAGSGSKREIELEQELDMLESRRARIMEANFKWRQAQMMMEYACRQLALAVQKWQDLPEIPTIELEVRYTMAAETRKSLMDASHSDGSQRYIGEAPYLHPDNDADNLNREVACVFDTGDDDDDPEKARQRLQHNHQKASSLLRWFEQVLNTTIMQDLEAINRQVRETTMALREERVRLIKQKVKEIWGTDVQVEIEEEELDAGGVNGVDSPSQQGNTDPEGLQLDMDPSMEEFLARMSPTMNMYDLGQISSSDEVFGKSYEEFKRELDDMRQQHETEMGQFLREQDRQAAKTRGDLQAKLEARRRYRAMRNLETKQRQALANGATVS